MREINKTRRKMLIGTVASGVAAAILNVRQQSPTLANAEGSAANTPLGPLRRVKTQYLEIAYHELGPGDGNAVLLLHGFPYDVHSYVEVAPLLAKRGYRVIVPYLRGHGATRFLNSATSRSGEQAALGDDTIALMDALKIPRAVLAGYDWGGRAACVAAALWPERCTGLVSVNSYLIQDIVHANGPLAAQVERGFWYQFYFLTERGRAGLTANRRDIARLMWHDNSPAWNFDDAMFARSAAAFDNPDYVDVVIHSYRHRLGATTGFPEYQEIEKRLSELPAITVPAVTLDGTKDGVVPATDGRSSAIRFTGFRVHLQIPGAGHNLPQETPAAFVAAVLEITSMSLQQ